MQKIIGDIMTEDLQDYDVEILTEWLEKGLEYLDSKPEEIAWNIHHYTVSKEDETVRRLLISLRHSMGESMSILRGILRIIEDDYR